MTELPIWIDGPPRTKKTSNRVVFLGQPCPACRRGRTPKVLPSEAWADWHQSALPGLMLTAQRALRAPISWPVSCAALFYRDAERGDAVGYYQGLADLLQDAQIVADDKWIVSWDGSRLFKDAQRPRVELVLSW